MGIRIVPRGQQMNPEDNTQKTNKNSANDKMSDTEQYKKVEEEKVEYADFCWGLCCFQGCVWCVLGVFYFFFVVPSGILMIFYGMGHGGSTYVWVGIVLLAVMTFVIPIIIGALCYYRRKQKKRKKERIKAYRARKEKFSQENPMTFELSQEDDVTDMI